MVSNVNTPLPLVSRNTVFSFLIIVLVMGLNLSICFETLDVSSMNGVATDRLIGFQDLGAKDDFPTRTLEVVLLKKGIIEEKKQGEDDDDYLENKNRTVRSSINSDSDSD